MNLAGPRVLVRGPVLVGTAAVLLLTGCTGDDGGARETSALELKVGQCVVPPAEPKAELAEVSVVDCTDEHTTEAFALVDYAPPEGTPARETYPGADALRGFADGACAQRYEDYVGTPYADSSLFVTYLLPSARSWQSGDRKVTCFVTTTGQALTRSVRGSRL